MQNRIYVVIFIGRWDPCTTAVFCFNAIEGFYSCCNNIAIISGSRECIVRWPKGELPVLRGYDPVDNKVVLVYGRINPVGTAGILCNVELLQVRICPRISLVRQMHSMRYNSLYPPQCPLEGWWQVEEGVGPALSQDVHWVRSQDICRLVRL